MILFEKKVYSSISAYYVPSRNLNFNYNEKLLESLLGIAKLSEFQV